MKKNSWWSRLSVVAFIVCAFAVSAIAETLIVDPPVITDPGAQSVMIGVAFVLPLEIVSADNPLKSVTVTGLPAGLKYNAKAKTITGVPAAIPKKATPVTITAKNASKTPAVQTFAITVEPLPAWAYGTFNGYIDGRENSGTASMTVTSLGKITGKLVVWGETYAFSAASYAAGGNPADGFSVTVNPNKQFAPLPLTVSKPAVESAPQALGVVTGKLNDSMNGSCTTNHDCLSISDLPVIMYRDVWKEISTTPPTGYYTATLPGNGEYGSGYLALTVDAAGKVKTAGKLADGTVVSLGGTLILDETEPGRVFAVIYASPAAYKDSCLFGLAEFVKGDGHVFVRLLDGVPFLWENYNPLSTQDYPSNGFARDLGLSGGLYDNMIDLQTYYANGLTVGGINPPPSLFVAVKYTDFDPESEAEKPPKKTTTVIEEVPDAGVSPDGLVLAGLAAPKADTPKKVIDPDTKEFFGEYNYADLNNPTGLTISFTQATGIFKGSFNAYYDYISADNYTLEEPHPTWSHVVRKASYEGVLTPGRENTADGIEGRGFYLWPGKSTYEKLDKEWNPVLDKNGDPVLISYSFDWSYDFILQSGE